MQGRKQLQQLRELLQHALRAVFDAFLRAIGTLGALGTAGLADATCLVAAALVLAQGLHHLLHDEQGQQLGQLVLIETVVLRMRRVREAVGLGLAEEGILIGTANGV